MHAPHSWNAAHWSNVTHYGTFAQIVGILSNRNQKRELFPTIVFRRFFVVLETEREQACEVLAGSNNAGCCCAVDVAERRARCINDVQGVYLRWESRPGVHCRTRNVSCEIDSSVRVLHASKTSAARFFLLVRKSMDLRREPPMMGHNLGSRNTPTCRQARLGGSARASYARPRLSAEVCVSARRCGDRLAYSRMSIGSTGCSPPAGSAL